MQSDPGRLVVGRLGVASLGAILLLLTAGWSPPALARELRRREVTFDDAHQSTVPELHVAPALATVLAFKADVRDATFVKPVGSLFQKLTRTERTVVLVPKQAVKEPVTLSVAMADGTILTFALVTAPGDVDAQVDVKVLAHVVADTSAALRAEAATLRSQLEECQSQSEAVGASKIAALILAQGVDAPQAFETHPMRGGDRQSRLLVQARRMYRLLGLTYVVLSVDNRDPERNWVLARPEVHLTGGGQDVELTVVAHATDQLELPPDNQQRVVVAFKTPQALQPGQRISVALVEKDGGRRVELRDLEL